MRSAVELDEDFVLGDGDGGGHVDKVAEDLSGLPVGMAAHPVGEHPVQAAGDHEQGHVEVDLEADGR